MLARLRFLKGATALLYLGPLFAGLSGFGFAMLVPFVSIFVMWLMILRPEQWPATGTEWLTKQAWGAAITQVLSQILLVTVLFGIGRGVGGVAGFLPMTHPLLPLGLSLAAIPISRMFWDSRSAADAGFFIDDEAAEAQAPHLAAEAVNAVHPLLALPDDAPEDLIRQIVADVLSERSGPRLDALVVSLERAPRAHSALRRALVIWATEPEVVAPNLVPDAAAAAFAITNRHPDLLRLYLPRALALVAAFPDRASGFPSPATLRHAAVSGPDTGPNADVPEYLLADLGDGLAALARSVETALLQTRPAAEPARTEPVAQHAPRPA